MAPEIGAVGRDRDPVGVIGRCSCRSPTPAPARARGPTRRARRPGVDEAWSGRLGLSAAGSQAAAVSAATASPTTNQTRVARISSQTIRVIAESAAAWSRSVASVKLTLNRASASRSPSMAATARSRSRPARLTDHDPDDEEQEQVQPFGRIVDRQRVERLDEQEVVEQECADGRRDRRPGAAPRPRPRRLPTGRRPPRCRHPRPAPGAATTTTPSASETATIRTSGPSRRTRRAIRSRRPGARSLPRLSAVEPVIVARPGRCVVRRG